MSITTPHPIVRLAVAQTTQQTDPSDLDGIRSAGDDVRRLMRQARAGGADLIQFPEATFCFPDKFALSRTPHEVTEAEWHRFPWDVIDDELQETREAARTLGLWTVVGAQVRAIGRGRPRTSMIVVNPGGHEHARYDERRLSRSKARSLYEPGQDAVTFEVNGVTFGVASGLEVLFGDIFLAYEDAGADAVLFSTAGPADPAEAESLATSARAMGRQHGLAIGYSAPTSNAPHAPSGIIGFDGRWSAQCPAEELASVAFAEISSRPEDAARAWRRAMVAAD